MQFQLPGFQVDDKVGGSDSEESDEEVKAAKKKARLKELQDQERKNEEQQKIAAEERAKQVEEMMDKEQFIPFLSGGEAAHPADKPPPFLADVGMSCRPEGWEARVKAAGELREKAKALFQKSEVEFAAKHWLAAIHCLDFTPRQLEARTKEERVTIYEASLPIFCNMAIGARKMNDPMSAVTTSNIGLIVSEKVPYKKSKDMRVKLRLQRSLARGERRHFEEARNDAEHVLQLSPGHEEAKLIIKNCDIALRLEKGPESKRWKGPLTRNLVRKAQKANPSEGIFSAVTGAVSHPACKYVCAFLLPLATAWVVLKFPSPRSS